MIKFTFITLFPEAIQPYLNSSMMWKAVDRGLAEFNFVNLRDFGLGPHKSVDDTPYGGGDGMLIMAEPVFAAIESVREKDPNIKVLVPTPSGVVWDQSLAKKLAKNEDGQAHYVIFCPRYEGFDERIMSLVDLPISMGQYIVTGGELPALIIADSVVRLIDGVLGGEKSAEIESFSDGNNLEFPQWTKPAEWNGMKVPDILLSGNHGEIEKWRQEQAKQRMEMSREFKDFI